MTDAPDIIREWYSKLGKRSAALRTPEEASRIAKKAARARSEALTPERRAEIASNAGKASAAKLTPEERSAAARKRNAIRWTKDHRL